MNWFIPALVSSSPDSGGGINEDEGTRLWSRSSKKRRNDSRIRSPSMAAQSIGGHAPDRASHAVIRPSGRKSERVAEPLGPKGRELHRREPAVVDQNDVAVGHGQLGLERGHLAALPERRAARRPKPDPVGAVGHDRGLAPVAAHEHDGLVAHVRVAAMAWEPRELDEPAGQVDPVRPRVRGRSGGRARGRTHHRLHADHRRRGAGGEREAERDRGQRAEQSLPHDRDTRSGAPRALALPEARPGPPLGVLELRAQLLFPPLHGDLALVDRLGDQLGQVQHAAASLAGEVGGRNLGRLPANEARGDDRAGGPGAQAEGHPEQPPHAAPFFPPNRLTARRRPAPSEMILTSGLATACSTRPEIRWTRPTISPVASSTTSTRSSSRLVRSTEPLTSRSSGTVSSRIESIRIFVLSSTRNVLISTMPRNRTNRPQNEE